jgi:poly(3-hydroxybutyrate) depolymerase
MLMSYQMRELHSAAWAPLLPWLRATASLLDPADCASGSPARQVAAGCELLVRLYQTYPKPEFGLTQTVIDGQPVAVTETVVMHRPFCRLLHFERAACRTDPVVLLVAPLSGHHATLLRETVATMLPEFDVYITDWCNARTVPLSDGLFHLDDYIAYLCDFFDLLGPDSHIVAICQSTVPVLAAVSLMATRGMPTPRSMTLMGGPIDARRSPTAVNVLAVSKPLKWFERQLIDTVPSRFAGAGRAVYPGHLQHAAFVSMNPERHLASHLNYYFDVVAGDVEAAQAHRRFYDEYNAVLDMPAEYYLETVRVVFQEYRLACGTWSVNGELVRPQDIRNTALITVEGERDDICGSGQTHAAQDLCTGLATSHKHPFTAAGCGHYGIFSGGVWRTQIYPRLCELIRQHDMSYAPQQSRGSITQLSLPASLCAPPRVT